MKDPDISMRTLAKTLIDLTLWLLAAPFAFVLRLPSDRWADYFMVMFVYALLGSIIKLALILAFNLNRRSWRYSASGDFAALSQAVVISIPLLYAIGALAVPRFELSLLPRSIPFIEAALALLWMAATRVLASVYFHWSSTSRQDHMRRVLIVGVHDEAFLLAQSMLQYPNAGMKPVGFLSTNGASGGQSAAGLPVLGKLASFERIAQKQRIDEVVISIPESDAEVVRDIFSKSAQHEIRCRIAPRVNQRNRSYQAIPEIRDLRLEDLLHRSPVHLDLSGIADVINGRTVMVTGAGGSIGSELVRQIARFYPSEVLLVGRGEGSLVEAERDLHMQDPELRTRTLIADTRDRERVDYLFDRFRPELVFHAAAHKHVPIMEANPEEAILNNVIGARNITETALQYGVQRLVNISTDKAVNPQSIMGASKRITEYIVSAAATRRPPGSTYVSVRFGNVLGSRGSVVPFFQQQIRRGGPVTVTHPDMERFFMTIPEATQLVLQASILAYSGVVYVLDMGQSLKIDRLARDMIALAGLVPGKDIDIIYTGMRPGERLKEELLMTEEGTSATTHHQILIANQKPMNQDEINAIIDDLLAAARTHDMPAIQAAFRRAIPTYSPVREAAL